MSRYLLVRKASNCKNVSIGVDRLGCSQSTCWCFLPGYSKIHNLYFGLTINIVSICTIILYSFPSTNIVFPVFRCLCFVSCSQGASVFTLINSLIKLCMSNFSSRNSCAYRVIIIDSQSICHYL